MENGYQIYLFRDTKNDFTEKLNSRTYSNFCNCSQCGKLILLTFYVKSLLMIFQCRKDHQHFSKLATLHPDAQQHQFFACHWHIVIIGRCACSDDAGTATCGQLLVQCFHFVPWSFGILTSFEIMCCRCIEK